MVGAEMGVWEIYRPPHTRWAKGAYTCPSSTEVPHARRTLLEPHCERVFFAGEHTSGDDMEADSPMTVHGTSSPVRMRYTDRICSCHLHRP